MTTYAANLIAQNPQPQMDMPICNIKNCNRIVRSIGLCSTHYSRHIRGTQMMTWKEKFIIDNKPNKNFGKIPLTEPHFSFVDINDYYDLIKKEWSFDGKYGVRYENHKKIYMHSAIMKHIKGFEIDHINGRKLDNRRENLRHCLPKENCFNKSKWGKKGASRYKGVFWNPQSMSWYVGIGKNYNKYCVIRGCKTEKEAAIYYNVAAQLFFGKFAILNDV